MERPRIAIPVIDQDVTNYIRALQAAGMEPAAVSPPIGRAEEGKEGIIFRDLELLAASFDGLLLPGGGDIHPARYGRENQGSRMIREDADELQLAVLDGFVKAKKPVLGVCRGHQVINVYFGGTLIQDLPAAFRHVRGPGGTDQAHGCAAEKGSWLARLYGEQFVHNSAHHQAVERPGKGLHVDAICPEDGTVEAMHHSELPIYSVQWHPERMCLDFERNDTVNGLPVFRFFYQICAGGSL